MKHFKMHMLSCLLATVLITVLLTTEVAAAAPLKRGVWSIVPSLNVVGVPEDVLEGVAAVSAKDVWAVGFICSTFGCFQMHRQTLIEHWNGKAWSIVQNPPVVGSNRFALVSVTAVSANDVWAVGTTINSNNLDQTLIEHWNGRDWKIVLSPNLGPGGNELASVTAVSSTDVWAVGSHCPTGACGAVNATFQTLIEHWNGKKWRIVSSPNVAGSSEVALTGVTASSGRNIWAAGDYTNSTSNHEQTLIEHWNGRDWKIISSPNVSGLHNFLNGIGRVPDSEQVWAVGDTSPLSFTFGQVLIEHWNGKTWSIVSSPPVVGSSNAVLKSVAAISANDVWAVGAASPNGSSLAFKTLIEHWNGKTWSIVLSPNVGSNLNSLAAVAVVSHTSHAWAVGTYKPDNNSALTLTEFFSERRPLAQLD